MDGRSEGELGIGVERVGAGTGRVPREFEREGGFEPGFEPELLFKLG